MFSLFANLVTNRVPWKLWRMTKTMSEKQKRKGNTTKNILYMLIFSSLSLHRRRSIGIRGPDNTEIND